MTIYDFMMKMGMDEPFHIIVNGNCVTVGGHTTAREIRNGAEDREEVLKAVEAGFTVYDHRFKIIEGEA